MLTTLNAKNKVEFVLGIAPRPATTESTYALWTRCNNMVISWLVHSVSLSIRPSILWMDNATTIWNDIQHKFSQGDRSRISTLQMVAATLCQGDLSVSDYFTKLRIIWDELDNFRPDPICTCKPKCSCILSSVLSLRKSEDQSMQFLRGLNDNFHNI